RRAPPAHGGFRPHPALPDDRQSAAAETYPNPRAQTLPVPLGHPALVRPRGLSPHQYQSRDSGDKQVPNLDNPPYHRTNHPPRLAPVPGVATNTRRRGAPPMMAYRPRPVAMLLAVLVALAAIPAQADPVADFYRGKTIHLIVGTSPGNDYDYRGRIIARHMGRHIPGEPMIVP